MYPCLDSPSLSPSSTPLLSFSYLLRAVRKKKKPAFLCAMFLSFSNFPFHFFLVILFPFNIWGEKSFNLKVSQIHRHNVLGQVSIFKYKVYSQLPVFSIQLLLKKEGKKSLTISSRCILQLSQLLLPSLVCSSLEALQACLHNTVLMTAQVICGKSLVWKCHEYVLGEDVI